MFIWWRYLNEKLSPIIAFEYQFSGPFKFIDVNCWIWFLCLLYIL